MSLSQTSVYMVTMHCRAVFTSKISDDCKHKASERLVAMSQYTGTRCQCAVSYITLQRTKCRLIPQKMPQTWNTTCQPVQVLFRVFSSKIRNRTLAKTDTAFTEVIIQSKAFITNTVAGRFCVLFFFFLNLVSEQSTLRKCKFLLVASS